MDDDDVRQETSLMWTDALFLNDQGHLHDKNVLDYFLMSSFVDPKCMNIIARDRGLTTEAEVLAMAPAIEYSLAYGKPAAKPGEDSLFIIERRRRDVPNGPQTVTAVYYVRNNAVFRAPSVYPVFSCALVQAANCLQKALMELPGKTGFNLAKGHQWNFLEEAQQEENDALLLEGHKKQVHDARTAQVLASVRDSLVPAAPTTASDAAGDAAGDDASAAQVSSAPSSVVPVPATQMGQHARPQGEESAAKRQRVVLTNVNQALGRR